MAKKTTPKEPWHNRRCHECANAYDWHHLSVYNIPTLAHCEHHLEGKYCVWRSKAACKHFKERKDAW